MSFLLDTNVVSEWTKPRPEPRVVHWLEQVDEEQVHLSVATLAELRHGIERLPAGRRRQRLDDWLHAELLPRFGTRIVPVDEAIADECGRLVARGEARGRTLEAVDALIAATARVRSLTLVTRNGSDFGHWVDSLVNPWA